MDRIGGFVHRSYIGISFKNRLIFTIRAEAISLGYFNTISRPMDIASNSLSDVLWGGYLEESNVKVKDIQLMLTYSRGNATKLE